MTIHYIRLPNIWQDINNQISLVKLCVSGDDQRLIIKRSYYLYIQFVLLKIIVVASLLVDTIYKKLKYYELNLLTYFLFYFIDKVVSKSKR